MQEQEETVRQNYKSSLKKHNF